MLITEALANRTVGQYPLSIATSLAMESANGIHPDILVNRPPILDYEELWVNVRTLFRNLMGSLDKEGANTVQAAELATTIAEEMETILSLVAQETHGKTKVVFYVSQYSHLETIYTVGQIRADSTDRQRVYTAIQDQTIDRLLKMYLVTRGIILFERKLEPSYAPKALIITHYAYDLLSHKNFSKLVLLESHTGKLKEQAQWYTKYLNGKDLSMIPFREDFIQIFGDSETFRPGNPKLRKEIIEIATKYKWTAVTTRDKLMYGINQMQDQEYREILRSILI